MAGWIAAATIGSALIGSSAAKSASNKSAASTDKATDLAQRKYEEGVAREQPFYEAGVNALPGYVSGIQKGGDLVRGFTAEDFNNYQDPGYGFRMSEGMKALNATAAARGGTMSGNALRGAVDYGQQAGSQEYTNAYNRYIGEQATRRNALANMVGQGQTTANTMNNAGAAMANNVGNAMINQGVNNANASLYGANSIMRGVNSLGDIASKYYGNQGSSNGYGAVGYGAGGGRAYDYLQNMQDYGI